MIVCVCNNLSDRRLRAAASAADCPTPGALFRAMGCRARCGRCLPEMRRLAQEGQACRPASPTEAAPLPAAAMGEEAA